MEEAILKADVLIEAMGYIRQFRDRLTVIKLGGSAMEDAAALRATLLDVVFMETVGMRPILVHGGGSAISRAMAEAGLKPHFVQGRRYTDAKTLEIVTRVLTDEINRDLVSQIEQLGGRAAGLHDRTTNCLKGEGISLEDESGGAIDLGFVGRVEEVDRRILENLCDAGVVPVVPSIAVDASGQRLNVNADTAAAAVARELRAEKLVFLSDVSGILREPGNPESLANSLTAAECRALMAGGIIGSGMIPKVEACLESLEAGVRKTHIVDGRVRHSLLLEIYTDRGMGTEIVLKRKEDCSH